MKTYLLNQKQLFLTIFLLLTSYFVFSQERKGLQLPLEMVDDPYVEVDKGLMPTQEGYSYKSSSYFTSQVNVNASGNDVIGDAANEPSIAVDPTNPNRMVIGWRQFDTVTNNFRQAGYGYSLDGGLTWTFPGVINPGLFRSDPVLDFDANGNFFYNSLTSGFTCDVFSIQDGGTNWNSGVPAFGGDKQWMRIDRTGGVGDGFIYANWNVSFSTCAGDFTRSINAATSFEDCTSVDNSPRWGTLAVNSTGDLYIVGTSNVGEILIKSTTADDSSNPVSFDSVTNLNLGGFLTGFVDVNPAGLLGQLWVDVDVSGGANDGTVYVLASVDRSSVNGDPGDVMFIKSTDGGNTFSAPMRINTDSGTTAYQWLGTMAVAPNGRIDVVWLDTRDAPAGTHDSVLYYTFSEDQGTTWTPEEAISPSFDPHIGYPNQDKMGDYFDMVSTDAGAHLAWANTLNGGQDVYYTFINPDLLGTSDFQEIIQQVTVSPNPFSDETAINFTVNKQSYVLVSVFDVLGRKITTLLNETVLGNQQLTWQANGEQSGLYFIQIKSEKGVQTFKVVKK